jgi:hypothetical protein
MIERMIRMEQIRKIHKYKEGLEFTIVNTEGISNDCIYLGDSLTCIGELQKGYKVKLMYSRNSNRELEYVLQLLGNEDCKVFSDYLTEDEVTKLMGNN